MNLREKNVNNIRDFFIKLKEKKRVLFSLSLLVFCFSLMCLNFKYSNKNVNHSVFIENEKQKEAIEDSEMDSNFENEEITTCTNEETTSYESEKKATFHDEEIENVDKTLEFNVSNNISKKVLSDASDAIVTNDVNKDFNDASNEKNNTIQNDHHCESCVCDCDIKKQNEIKSTISETKKEVETKSSKNENIAEKKYETIIDKSNSVKIDKIPDSVKNEPNFININTASIDELMILSGIGEKKANAIIQYRKQNGKFQKIEDIMSVSGIGQKTFEKNKTLLKI